MLIVFSLKYIKKLDQCGKDHGKSEGQKVTGQADHPAKHHRVDLSSLDDKPVEEDAQPQLQPTPPNTVRMRFSPVDIGGDLLVVENPSTLMVAISWMRSVMLMLVRLYRTTKASAPEQKISTSTIVEAADDI